MTRPVIVTCAVNGGRPDAHQKHTQFPVTPEQICEAVREAAKAGAAIAHIHARDPETGAPTNSPEVFAKIVDLVRRDAIDILLNLSCSMDATLVLSTDDPQQVMAASTLGTPGQRVSHVVDQCPEIATIDCGSFAVGETLIVARRPDLDEMARLQRTAGVKSEIECFDLGHLEIARDMIASGAFEPPPLLQICLGTAYGGAPATAEALAAMRSRLPEGCRWAVFAAGPANDWVMDSAIAGGGHIRVGLEDQLLLPNGAQASNGNMVIEAIDRIKSAGCSPATSREARTILGL